MSIERIPTIFKVLFAQSRNGKSGSFPLRLHIATLFSVLTFTLGLALTYFHQIQTSKLMLSTSRAAIERSGSEITRQLDSLADPIHMAIDTLAQRKSLQEAATLPDRIAELPFLIAALRSVPMLASVFIGYPDGEFFIVFALNNNTGLRMSLDTPAGSVYLVGSITQDRQGMRHNEFIFFDGNLRRLGTAPAHIYDQYDPRQRPWYQLAQADPGHSIVSPFYLFHTSKRPASSFARQSSFDSGTVVGTDLGSDTLTELLKRQRIAPSARIWLLDAQRNVIAGSLDNDALALKEALLTRSTPLNIEGKTWHALLRPVRMFDRNEAQLLFVIPETELLEGVDALRWQSIALALLIMAGFMPIIWWQARRMSQPLERITQESSEISRFHFEERPFLRTGITEINELGRATRNAKDTIRRFQEICMALASEHDFNALLARILQESSAIAHARGGILYLRNAEEGWLTPAQALWDRVLIADIDRIPAISEELRLDHPVLRASREGTVSHVLEPIDFLTWFGALGQTRSRISALAIALRNREDHTVGVLLLLEEEATRSGPLAPELVALMEAISGTAAIAIETQRLLQEQQDLLEAFIQLIASAIDAKSPYTGGHCQRVPDLARMLAQAACHSAESPWTHFRLDEAQWQALHIASWLHDCGKITTPEYVVDKATKLETIYDRIHEIRMRFEVLKRDAEIEAWKAIAAGADHEQTLAALSRQQATLDEEFAFVAQCNPGSEFMGPEKIAKLHEIASRTWLRTLDDALGTSRGESERKKRTSRPALPVIEPLLADKEEHLVERSRFDYPNPDWKFNLQVPEYLYNRGELYNLSVARGTLTFEERYKVNEHIIQTIQLLDSLPLPKHLQAVPEIACGHHEKMDGSGYPLGLKRVEMSELARMMAVADIFEALTAGDRPYKPGKTLSEALEIMSKMKAEHHIDPDIFDLFLKSGVYMQYARRYMDAEQIDEVDIERLIAIRPA